MPLILRAGSGSAVNVASGPASGVSAAVAAYTAFKHTSEWVRTPR
ncbi:hypothetical protein [Arthrobacter sp. BPSS-3]